VPAALALAACIVASSTHALLESLQGAGLLASDYGEHAHAAVVPVAIAGVGFALAATLLYVLHLLGAGQSSLPLLARALRKRIGWRSALLIAVAGGLLLAGMESAEQIGSGQFDGPLSAFSSVPMLGIGLVFCTALLVNAVFRTCCSWLGDAHTHIILALGFLLRMRRTSGAAVVARSRRVQAPAYAVAYNGTRTHGKRGPPRLR
jgi:hypothetical protein